MFSEELEKIDWEKITKAIYSKTEHDVLRALGKEHCDVTTLWHSSPPQQQNT